MFTSDSLALGGINNGLYDFPNYYQLLLSQANMGNIPALGSNTTTLGTNPTFGSQINTLGTPVYGNKTATESKSNSKHVLACGITALIALGGATYWMVSRGKAAGAKGFTKQFVEGIKSFGKKSAKNGEQISRRIVNGEAVYTVPQKSQTFRATDIETNANALGLNINKDLKWTDEAARIKGYTIEIKDGGFDNIITVRDGKVVNCINKTKGENFTDAYNSGSCNSDFIKKINDTISAVSKKNETLIAADKDINVLNICYGQEIAPGSQVLYCAKPRKGSDGIRLLKTNRFQENSNYIFQTRRENTAFDNAIKALEGKNPDSSNWQVAEATYHPQNIKKYEGKESWPSNVMVKYENGSPIGIIDTSIDKNKVIKYGDAYCDTLRYKFPEAFEPVTDISKFNTDIVTVLI